METITDTLTRAMIKNIPSKELNDIPENKPEMPVEDEGDSDVESVASSDSGVSNMTLELKQLSKPRMLEKFRTKKQLVEEILKIDNSHSKRKLQRMKKAELE